eukprot:12309865-Alexandrium_andersonii.AAC.1
MSWTLWATTTSGFGNCPRPARASPEAARDRLPEEEEVVLLGDVPAAHRTDDVMLGVVARE